MLAQIPFGEKCGEDRIKGALESKRCKMTNIPEDALARQQMLMEMLGEDRPKEDPAPESGDDK